MDTLELNIREELGTYFKFVSVEDLGNLISRTVGIAIAMAGILLLFYLIMGGLQWITSGGEKTGVAEAKAKITNAFVGLIIVLAAYAILSLVRYMFGLPGRPSGEPGPGPGPGPSPICSEEDLKIYEKDKCLERCQAEKNCSGHCRTNKNEFGATFCECVPGIDQKWADPNYSKCVPKD